MSNDVHNRLHLDLMAFTRAVYTMLSNGVSGGNGHVMHNQEDVVAVEKWLDRFEALPPVWPWPEAPLEGWHLGPGSKVGLALGLTADEVLA